MRVMRLEFIGVPLPPPPHFADRTSGSSDPSACRQVFGRVFSMKPVIPCFLKTSMRNAPEVSEG